MKAIDELWNEFRQALDAADTDEQKAGSADGHAEVNALHDYTTRRGWRMDSLMEREAANERQHRRGSANPRGFTVGAAIRWHIMYNAAYGATRDQMIPAHLFLTMRPTAAEADVIGYLARKHLTADWRQRVNALDYSELMQTA